MEFFTDKIVINSIELQTQANEQGKLQVSAKIKVRGMKNEKIWELALYISEITVFKIPDMNSVIEFYGLYVTDHKKEVWELENRYELYDEDQELRIVAKDITVLEEKVINDRFWYEYLIL